MHSRERSSPTISTGSNSGSDDESVSGRKRSSQLTRQVLEEYFKYSQEEAASRLGVSLSTLKRKFRSLKMGKRWPFQEAVSRTRFYVTHDRNK
jgi:DNA-binding NtrC family response regulator